MDIQKYSHGNKEINLFSQRAMVITHSVHTCFLKKLKSRLEISYKQSVCVHCVCVKSFPFSQIKKQHVWNMVYKFITISCVCVFYQLHTLIIPLKLAYSLLCASMDKQLETLINEGA